MILAFVKKVLSFYVPQLLLLALPVVAVWSWIASIYSENDIRSLLDADGIRWAISNSVHNLSFAPLAETLLCMVCLGVCWESGLIGSLVTVIREMKWTESSVSLKQRRALMLTLGVFEFLIVVFVITYFFPGSPLLSAFGTYESSALSEGLYGLLAVFVIILCNVYGYSSGKFVKASDFISAHTCFVSRCSGYFITMFLASELIACIKYTGLFDDESITVLSYILYYIPLIGEGIIL